MNATTTWTKITKERYWEMLEILPPACMTGNGFLVGEPWDHNSDGQPRFAAFVEIDGDHFEASGPMTVAEFKAVDRKAVQS